MKTSLVLSLLILLPFFGFSQINSSIDFLFGIEYSNRNLNTSSDDGIILFILESRDGGSGKINGRFGFNYNRKITNKIFFKTGIRLASVGYKLEKRTDLVWASEIGPNLEVVFDPSLPHEIQIIDDFWFLEVPVVVRYELSHKKLTPFFEVGVSPSIYLTTRTKTVTDIDKNAEFDNSNLNEISRVQLVGSLSMGLNYSLNDNIQFFWTTHF